jgi:hypothetical protein
MSALLAIERTLVDIGARQFNPPVKKARRATPDAVKVGQATRSTQSGRRSGHPIESASDTRARLQEIVERTPQVMVKITGSAKSAQHLTTSLDYISRNGQIELETDRDQRLASREDNRDLTRAWQAAAAGTLPNEIGEGDKAVRHTLNIVLSMPFGTDKEGVKAAARDFAEHHFAGNHPYVMAAHVDDDNPLHRDASSQSAKADKPLNPHVHLIVLMRGRDGVRLNPRKADLMAWREVFAQKLRDRGISAAATNRQVRGAGRGRPAPVVAMAERGVEPKFWRAPSLEGNPFAGKAQATQYAIAENYMRMAQALRASDAVDDQRLAKVLIERYAQPAYEALERKGHINGREQQARNESRIEQGIESRTSARIAQQYRAGWHFAALHQSGIRQSHGGQEAQVRTGLRDVSGLGLVRDQTVQREVLLSKDARRDVGRGR